MPEAVTRAQLAFKAKELRKLSLKETQPALKRYYIKELGKASKALSNCIKNDSGYKSPRSSMTKLPQVKWELVG